MAYSPIAFIAPNFRDFKYHWLKAYFAGSTTPKSMALDSAGVVTVAKLQLNADGFLESAGGALVIPYLNGAYDLWLFPTEAEADANDTSSAEQLADDILGILADDAIETLLINNLSQTINFDNVAEYKAFTKLLPVKKRVYLADRDAYFNVIAGTGTANTWNIIESNEVSQSIDLVIGSEIRTRAWGADPTGVIESSDAMQAAAYAVGNLFGEVKTYIIEGEIKINKPILFYARDGLKIRGLGKIGSYLVPDGDMIPVLDDDFQALQNDGLYDYTFPACIIISAARRTGKADWDEVTKNTAQWHMCLEDFGIKDGREIRTIAGIHCPRIGNCKLENLFFKGLHAGIRAQDIYTTGIKHCFFTKVTTPIDHYSTGQFTATGTSVHLANCGISDCDYGWKFNKLQYSSMTACGVDGLARYQPTGDFLPTSFAYEMNQCAGFVITACGFEDTNPDKMKGIFKFTGGQVSSVIVDGGAFVLADVPSVNPVNLGLCVFDSQSVTLRGAALILNTDGGKIPFCDVLSGDVIVETLNQAVEWRRLFNFDNAAITARLLGNDPLQLAAVEGFRLFDEPFADNGTVAVSFGVSDLPFPNGRSGMWDNSRFTAPYAAAWHFGISILAEGEGLTYLAIQRVGGAQTAFFEFDPTDAGTKTYCPSQTMYLDKGEEVEIILRTAVGATGNLKNAQISITQVR